MSGLVEWTVGPILADDKGRRFYLDHYKPFRLAALKQDPDAFGSTYAREINFIEEDWLSRINNRLVKTFVAVPPNDRRRVLSTTSLIGPFLNQDPESNPFQACTEMTGDSDQHHNHVEASPLSFQLSGVYTTPDVRGKGIAKAVVNTAVEEAVMYAKQQNRKLNLSVVVYASNHAAIAFYQSCGFVADTEGPRTFFNSHKNCYEVELCMHYRRSPE
ncbi:hypothetical protein F4776DRAFT_662278 [Hypoxylon sp. NC0597]|nr:hypothetical protein F4776DRAFT_662278 [Hypoxylon sp. NC0597]